MGHIVKTKAGTYRANWRDHTDRQRSKTFATKKEATAFLAEISSSLNRGTYVDPHAGKAKFGPYATKWMLSRNHEITTVARDDSIMRTHVLPRWRDVPLGRIDHSAVQTWVSDLSKRLAPATVAECHRLLSTVLKSAVRDRIVGPTRARAYGCPSGGARRATTGSSAVRTWPCCSPTSPAATGRSSAWPPAPASAGVSAWACAGMPSTSTPEPYGWSGWPSRWRAR
ncbi:MULTISPECIES: hypothetical protein [Microbispora]|uniref:hypothetical protein n=1 Tax=Microbispora TaxID=2005 RepID=UPI002E2C9156|nr:hypothetical protein [Microbispora hainanensis]